MDPKENFGLWLRHRRRALDLTQIQLADLAGCSTITIRKFEAGERIPSQELAILLARSLALSAEEQEWFVAFARGKATAEKPEQPLSAEPPLEITPNNLPAALTMLIGRDEDVTAVCRIITDPKTRLLTLTGPGGTGKTSLALEACRRLSHQSTAPFPDGITLVTLAPVTDPALVLPIIATTLALKEKGKQASQEALSAFLSTRRHLLLLDNFEQVVDAAGQLVTLLEAAPELKIIVTSRTGLHLYGEREYPVATLALPEPSRRLSTDVLLTFPAVSLFVERAQAVKPSFQLDSSNTDAVIALCWRLDGLPLAIELAAARCKFFTPEALLAQVSQRLDFLASQSRQLTDRQRTLKGAIEWSFNLLKADERRLFTRLSVFAGQFSPGDAAAVVGEPESGQLMDHLLGLVGHNVLQQVETADPDDPLRFRFLLVVREYALEQLAVSGEAAQMRDRHANHYLALAEEASQFLMKEGQAQALKILDKAIDNLRAALTWLFTPDGSPSRYINGTRLVVALQRYWDTRGQLQEMEIWCELALTHRAILPPELLASLLHTAILMATYRSDYDKARRITEEAYTLANRLEDSTILAKTLHFTGLIAGQIGRYEEADDYLTQALELEQQAGPARHVELSILQNNLAIVAYRLEQYDRAVKLVEESLRLKRARNDRRAVATSLSTLGNLVRYQGDYQKAAEYLQESLMIRVELNDRMGLVHSFSNLASLALAQGDFHRSVVLYASNQKLRDEVQFSPTPIDQQEIEANIDRLKERLDSNSFDLAWNIGQSQSLDEAITFAVGESDGMEERPKSGSTAGER